MNFLSREAELSQLLSQQGAFDIGWSREAGTEAGKTLSGAVCGGQAGGPTLC